MTSDAVFYISPIVFGQYSATIKNAIDRWLPNMLPFFMTRPDGSTIHPPRYDDYPQQIVIGYAEDLTEDDASLFTDISIKHRNNMQVLIYQDDPVMLHHEICHLNLKRVGGNL